MSGNNWFHGGRRVLWAAALTFGCAAAASAGTVIVDSNASATGDVIVGSGTGSNSGLTVPIGTSNWYYMNVRAGATVGINLTDPRSGNGSVRFTSTDGDAKADIVYGTGQSLGTLDELTWV